MALKDLFKPKSPAELRHKITTDLLAAQVHLTHARSVYGKAETDLMEGLVDPSVAAKADADLAKAKREVDRLQASLDSLDERVREAEEKAKLGPIEERWFKSVDLAEKRQELFVKAQASMQTLADDIRSLEKITGELDATLPQKYGNASGALLPANDLLNKIRLEMTRLGIHGDSQARSNHDQKPLLDTTKGIPDMIREWREKAMAALKGPSRG